MKEISLIGLFNSKYDMFELLAIWNELLKVKFNEEYNPLKEINEHTQILIEKCELILVVMMKI